MAIPFTTLPASPHYACFATKIMLGAYINADRIEGSDYAKKNFGKISITVEM
jgi:hypothetical protein